MKRPVEEIIENLKRVRERNDNEEMGVVAKERNKDDKQEEKQIKNDKREEIPSENDKLDTSSSSSSSSALASASSSFKSVIKYNVDGCFLRVDPYWFDYCSWAKGRWFKQSLIAVFRREFRDRPAEYYSHACRAGLIRVNDAVVGEDYVVRQGDRIQHRIHRHEPPVLAEPAPEILHVGEGVLVVSKPPSIPMHPSGRYRHNSLTSLLLHRHPELFPSGHISCVNRLDRLVSGIVIISRSAEKADELRRAMQDMQFRKFYLARVKGDFSNLKLDNLPFATATKSSVSASASASVVVDCKASLLIVEHKLGLSCVADDKIHPAAKSSRTRFFHLHYDSENDFSVVLCEPVTGRTHQIRLHLQYLGFPIHNDPLYNNQFWKGLISENNQIYSLPNWIEKVKEMAQSLSKSSLFLQEDAEDSAAAAAASAIYSASSAVCPDCENPLPDPDPAALKIDLHAYKYSGPMGTFSTSLPSWAEGIDSIILKAAEVAFGDGEKKCID